MDVTIYVEKSNNLFYYEREEIFLEKDLDSMENVNLENLMIGNDYIKKELKKNDSSITNEKIEKNNENFFKVFKTEIALIKTSKQEYLQQRLNLIEKDKVFQDDIFQPISKSIHDINSNIVLNNDELKIVSEYNFIRSSQIFNITEHYDEVFSFAISSKINFGPLVNMNLFNCLLFLAVIKSRIQNIVFFINSQKAFNIRLLIQGKIKMVLIDDYLAVEQFKNKSPVPCFIRTSRKNMWINFIEKAIAKIYKGYTNILGLKCSVLFPYLSESPIFEYDHSEDNQQKRKLWKIFFKASKKNWIIFAELNEKESNEKYILKDSLFILSAFILNEEKFVKIYFPSKLYENIISIFNINMKHEVYKCNNYLKESESNSKQMLIIKFEDYCSILNKTYALKYEDNFSYSYQKYKVKNSNFQATKLKISKSTKLTLSMHLKTSKYLSRIIVTKLGKSENGTFYTENSMDNQINNIEKITKLNSSRFSHTNSFVGSSRKKKNLINNNDNSFIYINSSFGRVKNHNIELSLDEGIYIILFKILFNDKQESVVLSMYSDNTLKFEENFENEEIKLLENINLINKCFISIFNSYLSLKGFPDIIENSGDFQIISSLNDRKFGYSCIEFSNNSKTKILCINLVYEINGMILISHEKRNKHLLQSNTPNENDILKIFPGNKEILVFEWEKEFKEININFHPKYYLENIYFNSDKHKKSNLKKKIISDDLFYYEILHKHKIYLVFCNKNSKTDFRLVLDIQNLNNLTISNVKNLTNKINLNIIHGSKEIVIMKVINPNQESSYKINFSSEKLI